MNNILVIQTAFIGDVILATALLESMHQQHPKANIDIVVRKGNDSLFDGHPFINQVIAWNKKEKKYKNLLKVIKEIRKTKYDLVINLQRFAASGFMAMRTKSQLKLGFAKTPFAFVYSTKIVHEIGNGKHEIERNLDLLNAHFGERVYELKKPKLHVDEITFNEGFSVSEPYVVMAPASVWETKKLPTHKWIELMEAIDDTTIYLIGGPSDKKLLDEIKARYKGKNRVGVMANLSLLQSAKLIQNARMNYVNDSAPLHLASATNANVTAFFCSTVPRFGFGPLSDHQKVIETAKDLSCRPCGLHGFKTCPEGHFDCGNTISVSNS